jgi:hypothetical protein
MRSIISPTLLTLKQRETDINAEFEEKMFQVYKAITTEYHEMFYDLYKVQVNLVDISDPKTEMEKDAYWVIHRKEYVKPEVFHDIRPSQLMFGEYSKTKVSVLYGDTDSIMVKFDSDKLKESSHC